MNVLVIDWIILSIGFFVQLVSIVMTLERVPLERIKGENMINITVFIVAIYLTASAIATLFIIASCMLSSQSSERHFQEKAYVQADDPTYPMGS